jgi:peroxiredoxin
MKTISADLAQATVLSRDGEIVPFRALYQSRETLIVFVRHYGCIFCRERVGSLSAQVDKLEALGIDTVIIGNGTALMADAFAEATHLEIPLYTDPSRETYALAGMLRRFGMGLQSVGETLRSWRSGSRPGAVAGDIWQQGGLMLVQADGTVSAYEQDRSAGDFIDLNALIARLSARAA